MPARPRIFLDTSALFAGIWSAAGGARQLLRLGELEVIQLLVSPQVLGGIEEVVRRKAAGTLPTLAVLIDRSRAEVVPPAPPDLLKRCQEWISHPGDACILADTWHSEAEYLVTLDRAHFLEVPDLQPRLPFPLGTPGDCLVWLRHRLG